MPKNFPSFISAVKLEKRNTCLFKAFFSISHIVNYEINWSMITYFTFGGRVRWPTRANARIISNKYPSRSKNICPLY
jgi:hypothetical protein